MLIPWLGPALIVITGIVMLDRTWRTWPDVLVDFGRELYIPWQLAAGKVLYVDVAHLSGPLAPYWNALLFRIFGTGLTTLVFANVATGAVLISMLYVIFIRTGGWVSATAACLTFVTLFACGQFVRIGNYNWICPYSHDLTQGVLVSVAGIFCLSSYPRRSRLRWIAGAGLALGLLVLTKVEALAAGAPAITTGFALTIWAERPDRGRLVSLLAVFAGGVAVPLVLAFILFALAMPMGDVMRWPLGHWRDALRSEFVSMPMYRSGLGVDDLGHNLGKLLGAVFWYVVVFAPALVAATLLRRPDTPRAAGTITLAVLTTSILWWRWRDIRWLEAARPLPLFMLAAVVLACVAFVRKRGERVPALRHALQASVALFALGMLGKMLFNARIYHYGFALAMPAALVLVAALVDWVPTLLDSLGHYGHVVRAVALGALLVAVPAHLSLMQRLLVNKVNVIGEGSDAFLADDRGVLLRGVLGDIRARVGPEQTLVVFPEGIMVNYLSRRVNPTPYYQYSPLHMIRWGEETILQALEQRPPEYVLLMHRDTSHEGARFFALDYAKETDAWIKSNYHQVLERGSPPFRGQRFGMVLMQRNDLGWSGGS